VKNVIARPNYSDVKSSVHRSAAAFRLVQPVFFRGPRLLALDINFLIFDRQNIKRLTLGALFFLLDKTGKFHDISEMAGAFSAAPDEFSDHTNKKIPL
jgi:hypothetical protein